MKEQRGYIVILPEQIIEIPLSSNLSWLRMFYALPRELVEKRPEYLELPRNIRRLLDSEKYRSMLKSDSFWSLYGIAMPGLPGSSFRFRKRAASIRTSPETGRSIPATSHCGEWHISFSHISATGSRRLTAAASRSSLRSPQRMTLIG